MHTHLVFLIALFATTIIVHALPLPLPSGVEEGCSQQAGFPCPPPTSFAAMQSRWRPGPSVVRPGVREAELKADLAWSEYGHAALHVEITQAQYDVAEEEQERLHQTVLPVLEHQLKQAKMDLADAHNKAKELEKKNLEHPDRIMGPKPHEEWKIAHVLHVKIHEQLTATQNDHHRRLKFAVKKAIKGDQLPHPVMLHRAVYGIHSTSTLETL
ncbi:hypothetical protein DACRYDRAFT_25318 [Dacryopinax primogenitus]|uniref:Uncharacterized protein n=1 Tax=Dacryopinax primogenitus (strain DJM 731) TaxID=1858805 RepID=M5FQZ5_DACPD|nr:uncharacterized protein DACRYDRAFT_25318 [Dacryopinax primogenitus]EJT97229.1 hypothetical protein DACRYDRAFT_25318 [Dacryopinax primogenitus]